ncbi:hypothetical protein P152DRAFT_480294 [Eremomyces bilateralis CBS 781.70]|uniref:DUF7136 domain-containing protein n=1 Tax=Eremomyces bilateralis CBS 781.70 TaxID=1392243 RepID=A0A6G1GB75_9PEZI|nr:uncharacterized protein P152DRAFT_480294 [Eremomyces bilateralis CBS 781.70]KAF1815232.1 hypothetical protein P152DRAFT_480294 [Eremomyces bilateralis CBS 781.70]
MKSFFFPAILLLPVAVAQNIVTFPTDIEVDLVVPRPNTSYLVQSPFPLIFAIQNAKVAWDFGFIFRWELFGKTALYDDGRTGGIVSGGEPPAALGPVLHRQLHHDHRKLAGLLGAFVSAENDHVDAELGAETQHQLHGKGRSVVDWRRLRRCRGHLYLQYLGLGQPAVHPRGWRVPDRGGRHWNRGQLDGGLPSSERGGWLRQPVRRRVG